MSSGDCAAVGTESRMAGVELQVTAVEEYGQYRVLKGM